MAARKARSQQKSSDSKSHGDLSHSIRELMKSYSENLQQASFEAQRHQTQATYAYWDALEQALKQSSTSAVTEHVEEMRRCLQQNDALGYAEAQRKYLDALREAQLSAQDDAQQALRQYNERVQAIVNELSSRTEEKNATLARSLTDVLAKAEVTGADVPVLATLCGAMAYRANAGK